MKIKDLLSMYMIHSPSNHEKKLVNFIKIKLNEYGVNFKEDKTGQLYNIIKDTPLICAHMDQVKFNPITQIFRKNNFIYGDGNIGADDKNGIFICLCLLKKYKNKISFIFSTCEEIGGNIADLLPMTDNPYCLVFDRKGNNEIIGTKNNYCSEKFEKEINKIIKEKKLPHKFKQGVFSDCNEIMYYMNCVNISCGFNQAHTENEYTDINGVYNGLLLGNELIKNLSTEKEKRDIKKVDYYRMYEFCDYCGNFDKKIKYIRNGNCYDLVCNTCYDLYIKPYQRSEKHV